jgi:hypothetical protein
MRRCIQQENLASDKGKPFERRGRKASNLRQFFVPQNCYDGRAAEERENHPVVGGVFTRIHLANNPFVQAAAQQTGFSFEKGLPFRR